MIHYVVGRLVAPAHRAAWASYGRQSKREHRHRWNSLLGKLAAGVFDRIANTKVDALRTAPGSRPFAKRETSTVSRVQHR